MSLRGCRRILPLHCKISLLGYAACLALKAKGYENVKFIDGGVVAWPFDVERKA